jgi:hypothetical protein
MGSSSRSAIKTRLHVLGRAVTLLVIPFLASCGNDPAGPRLWPRYVLTSIDGAPLPHALVDVLRGDGTRFRRSQLADSIEILNATDFRRTASFYDELAPYPPGPYSATVGGTYSLRGDTLSLNFQVVTQYDGITTTSELFVVTSGGLRGARQVGPYCTQGSAECSTTPFVDFVYSALIPL